MVRISSMVVGMGYGVNIFRKKIRTTYERDGIPLHLPDREPAKKFTPGCRFAVDL